MKIKKLREFFGGSVESCESLRELDELLAPIEDLDISELISATKPALAKLAKAASQRRRLATSEALVVQYLSELNATKLDNSAFGAVIERAKKEKAVKVAEATELAGQFLGESKRYKSKSEALKAILKRQLADKRASDRGSQISEIF